MDDYRKRADAARDLSTELQQGLLSPDEWTEALVALDDPLSGYQEREECRNTILPDGYCEYTLDTVVERSPDGDEDDQDEGFISYVRATPSEQAEDACIDYASCIAKARIGRRVPLPDGVDDYARTQQMHDNRSSKLSNDENALRDIIELLESDTAAAKQAGNDGTPDWQYRVDMQERLIEAYELMLKDRFG